MPSKASAPDATPVSSTIRVKVRHKGAGLISKGERHDREHKDLFYATGEVFDAPNAIAQVLLDRDLVDYAD